MRPFRESALCTVVTNEDGAYAMPNLVTGPYQLEAQLQGFRTLTL